MSCKLIGQDRFKSCIVGVPVIYCIQCPLGVFTVSIGPHYLFITCIITDASALSLSEVI